jgi:hypothetical protein
VPDKTKTVSEQLRCESDELLRIAAKLMEHGTTLVARAVELEEQITRLKVEEAATTNQDKSEG